MNPFDGFAGILIPYTYINDVAFACVFALFFVLTLLICFRSRYFSHMLYEAALSVQKASMATNKEQSDLPNRKAFRTVMVLHALLLAALFCCAAADHWVVVAPTLGIAVALTIITSLFVLLLYTLKQGIYLVLGWTFAEDKRIQWHISQQSLTGLWGIFLYIPLVWQLLYPSWLPLTLFCLIYVLYRFALLIRTVRIFSVQADGGFFLCLYFCAQELIPLLLFYKGLMFLYTHFFHYTISAL